MRFPSVVLLAALLGTVPAGAALACSGGNAHPPSSRNATRSEKVREVNIRVTTKGFQPASTRVRAGEKLTLVVTRKTDKTCAKEIVISSLGIRQDLPLNQTVRIPLGPQPAGTIAFACGMDMIKGDVRVQE